MIFRWMKSEGPNLHFQRRYICSVLCVRKQAKIQHQQHGFISTVAVIQWMNRQVDKQMHAHLSHTKEQLQNNFKLNLKNDITKTELIENRAALQKAKNLKHG